MIFAFIHFSAIILIVHSTVHKQTTPEISAAWFDTLLFFSFFELHHLTLLRNIGLIVSAETFILTIFSFAITRPIFRRWRNYVHINPISIARSNVFRSLATTRTSMLSPISYFDINPRSRVLLPSQMPMTKSSVYRPRVS